MLVSKDEIVIIGDFKNCPNEDFYAGVCEAIEEMGYKSKKIQFRRGEREAFLLIRDCDPLLILYIGRDALESQEFVDLAHSICPNAKKVFWQVDATLGISNLENNNWAECDLDLVLTVFSKQNENEYYGNLFNAKVLYMPFAVRTRHSFPDRTDVQINGNAIFAGRFGDSAHAPRTKVLNSIGEFIHLFSFCGTSSDNSFDKFRHLYRNEKFVPCLNVQAKETKGTSSRFWSILQEGGFLMSSETDFFDFVDGEHFSLIDNDNPYESIQNSLDLNLSDREKIARNGFELAQKHHRYENRMKKIFEFSKGGENG